MTVERIISHYNPNTHINKNSIINISHFIIKLAMYSLLEIKINSFYSMSY